MGVRRVDAEKCDGCGRCVNHCPMDVLRLDKGKRLAYIKYIRDCQSCFLCQHECPQEAITCVAYFERRIIPAW